MKVFILDEIDYDNRGGQGRPFRTLDGAKAAAPPETTWEPYVDEDSWYGRAPGGREFEIDRRTLGD